jgi:hypothetical protein
VPKITDEDDVNLDEIDTDPPEDENDAEGADEVADADVPQDEQPDHENREPEPEEDQDDEDEQDKRLAAKDQEPARARRPRENDRIRSLNDDLRRSRDETHALQRRFDEFMQRSQQQNQQRESDEQRNQRRALMSSEEKMAEDLRDSELRTQRLIHQQTFTMQDATDKSLYDTRANSISGYRRYRDQVESERARLMQNGANVARRAVLAYLVGDKIVSRWESEKPSAASAQARRRVERQTVRTGNSRSDATQERRGRGKSLEERLENLPL